MPVLFPALVLLLRNEITQTISIPPKVQENVPVLGALLSRADRYTDSLFDSETQENGREIKRSLDVYVSEVSRKFITGEMSF